MTEPTKQPRPFNDPYTDEFAVEQDETWIVDQSPDTTEEPEPQEAAQARNPQGSQTNPAP